MNILVTGSSGFVGKNLVTALKCIKDGKDKTRNVQIDEIFEYDMNSSKEDLDYFTKECDFVFHLAGVNRPVNNEEFKKGNVDFTCTLLESLKKHNNKASVMLSSSIQASLIGRYGESDYGKTKAQGEELLFQYAKDNDVKVLVYRFPNLFGKWCKPNYNSVVATFCYNYANDLPIQVNDPSIELELVYIDDLIDELILVLSGQEHHCDYDGLETIPNNTGKYTYVPVTHKITLGEIVEWLDSFKEYSNNLYLLKQPKNSFVKKLYSTYLSYLPKDKVVFDLKMNVDNRGSFTELFKTQDFGQFSINVSKPGITKGEHFHHSKWEFFIVVSGRALIQERNIITNELYEFEVSGDKMQAVYMLPGFTHNIINLSDTHDLVTVMWANEVFNTKKPDTFYEKVNNG